MEPLEAGATMNTINENPYVGPRTFQQGEAGKFFGRGQEARDLLNLIIADRMVLFYAQSGAGKSSLINTRVIPGLVEKGFEVLPVGRVGGDLPPGCPADNVYVFNLMRSLHEHPGGEEVFAGLDLATFLARLNKDEGGYFCDPRPVEGDAAASGDAGISGDAAASQETTPGESGGPLVSGGDLWPRALIIDQFEELLSTHPEAWEQREGFFIQLAGAAAADPYLWVVLVMREDYAASLAPYTHLLPGGLRSRYYMQQMGREAALDAVKEPVKAYWRFDDGVAEQLVDDLSKIKVQKPDGSGVDSLPGPYVEPVQLQVVCYRLWESLGAGHSRVTADDLKGIGDVDQSLAQYYSERVAAVAGETGVPERKIRDWFGRQLITGLGVRGQVLKGDTTSGEMENAVVQKLQDAHLVRFENRGGATWIELTHDRLVEPIRADNAAWTLRNLSMLQRAAELWAQQEKPDGLLLNGQALVEAQNWAEKNGVTPLEQDFLDACLALQNREKLERENAEQAIKLESANKVAEVQSLRAAERDRAARKLSQRAVVLGVLALIAVVLAGLSYYAANQAQTSQAMAESSNATAVANQAIAGSLAQAIASTSTQDAIRAETGVAQTAQVMETAVELARQAMVLTVNAGDGVSKATLNAGLIEQNGQTLKQQEEIRQTQSAAFLATINVLYRTIQAPPTATPTPTPSPTPTPTETPTGTGPISPTQEFTLAGPKYVFANVTIDDVRVHDVGDNKNKLPRGSTVYRGLPGETIIVQIDYRIVPEDYCPYCIDEIQVGFSNTDPLGCIYLGIPDKNGVKDTGEISVTLPGEPGTYFLAFNRTQDYTCPVHWTNGDPDVTKDRYFLQIVVE
jgi:hypothetical protein